MTPELLAQRLAELQQWLGREIASRQVLLHPNQTWPMPRLIADATVVIDPLNDKEFPSINRNHVEHLGTSGLADRRIVDEIIEMYRSAGVAKSFFYVSPSKQSEDIEGWLQAAGLDKTVDLSVLWRSAERSPRKHIGFNLNVCEPQHAESLRTVIASDGDPFGSTGGTIDMLGEPNCYTFLASRCGVPAATGSLYVHRELGYLGNGKTLESFRRQGAQSALIAARGDLASELGCTDLAGETYRFLASSYSNLVRAGFVELYSRAIYRWGA